MFGFTISRFQLALSEDRSCTHGHCGNPILMIVTLSLLMGACNRQASAPAAPKTDLETFQGTWYLVMAMKDGKTLPEDKVKQTSIVFKDDTFRFRARRSPPRAKRGRSSWTKRKHQRRWTPPRLRKKSCSASTRWRKAVTKYASPRPVSHVPPLWVPPLGVAISSRSGHGRKNNEAKEAGFSD